MSEKFKGDDTELKMVACAEPAFAQTSQSLDEFYEGCYEASPFLLMLYEENRVPFSERVKRDAFVEFIKEVLRRFPVIGTYEAYLFILRAIFGELSDITFTVPAAGKLQIDVNATSSLEFDFIGRDALGNTFNMTTQDGLTLGFRGVSGIETEYELELLFSEIMPAGITPDITLTFFVRHVFIGEDGIGEFYVTTSDGDRILFTEVGA
jgi:hypothetical protein